MKKPHFPLLIIGILLLLVGLFGAVLGPLEIYCFTLFSQGGRFHYQGFGFGSLMFANLVIQIAGYYLIALIAIPLAIAHLRARRWARVFTLSLLKVWLIIGLPLIIIIILIALASKEWTPTTMLVLVLILVCSYLLFPALMIRFYQSAWIRSAFANCEPDPCRLEQIPARIRMLGLLGIFFTLCWHLPLLFSGAFPVFGRFVIKLDGYIATTTVLVLLALNTWGLWEHRRWAWWGNTFLYLALSASLVITLFPLSLTDIILSLNLPPTEVNLLSNVPIEGWHLSLFFASPLAATLLLLISSRRYFLKTGYRERVDSAAP